MDNTDAANMKTTIDNLAPAMVEAERKGPQVQAIWNTVAEIRSVKAKMDSFTSEITNYNQAIDRVQVVFNVYKTNLEHFDTDVSKDAIIDAQLGFDNYRATRFNEDLQTIDNLNDRLTDISVRGHSLIMKLRELVTYQTIIYAVQTFRNTRWYEDYIPEEDFEQILKVNKTSGRRWVKELPKFKKNDSFSDGLNLQVEANADFLKEKHTGRNLHSRDRLYKAIAKYVIGKNKQGDDMVLKPAAVWEAYTAARQVLNEHSFSDEDFKKFIGDWLAFEKAHFTRYQGEGKTPLNSQMSTLSFYQGGDTFLFSNNQYQNYVQIQNKAVKLGSYNAQVRIDTIYNALKYICEIFQQGQQIDAEKVKMLFTASNLQNMPGNILYEAFISANEFAQKNIVDVINAMNRQMLASRG